METFKLKNNGNRSFLVFGVLVVVLEVYPFAIYFATEKVSLGKRIGIVSGNKS